MIIDKNLIDLAQHITWPLVALIALFVLRKNLLELARGASNLKEVLGKGGDVITLMERIKELKSEAAEIKEMLEAISIKDKSKQLTELTEHVAADEQNGPEAINTDEMFKRIESAWQEVRDIIQRKSDAVGVKAYMMGTKGVRSTVDQLVDKGAITKRAAELAAAVSSQYQWMFRTSSPREDWLTSDVFESYMKAANEAKAALDRIVP